MIELELAASERPARADDCRKALSELARKRRTLIADVANLEEESAELLLTNSDEEIAARRAELEAKRLTLARYEVAIERLQDKLRQAESTDRLASVRARIRRGHELQARGVELIGQYTKLARQIDRLLTELEAGEREIVEIQREAKEAGLRNEAAETAEKVARPEAPAPLYSPEPASMSSFGIDRQAPWRSWSGGGVQLPAGTGGGPWIRGKGPTLPTHEDLRIAAAKADRRELEEEWLRENPRPTNPVTVRMNGRPEGSGARAAHERFEAEERTWLRRYNEFMASID
jgi:multidrug efflux pump subunit AcrA (membrane-fusion protein)